MLWWVKSSPLPLNGKLPTKTDRCGRSWMAWWIAVSITYKVSKPRKFFPPKNASKLRRYFPLEGLSVAPVAQMAATRFTLGLQKLLSFSVTPGRLWKKLRRLICHWADSLEHDIHVSNPYHNFGCSLTWFTHLLSFPYHLLIQVIQFYDAIYRKVCRDSLTIVVKIYFGLRVGSQLWTRKWCAEWS